MAEITKLSPEDFPPLLSEIPDVPKKLYVRGVLPPKNNKVLAVVGSRRMSNYGKEACEKIIRGLSGYPITIVSGLALGIDGVAHRSALSAGVHTVAVPGSGIHESVLYPRSHFRLAEEIIAQGGALLSEEEPTFRARTESFPKRNRIMAGMSHAVLIVEATQKSGTMITAKLAVDYNRELLCVPHSIFAEGGAGGHLFMKLGAAPVRSTQDIIELFGFENKSGKPNAAELLPEEQKVLNLLSEPLQRDELIRALGVRTSEANALLLKMELDGLIQESLGQIRKS